MTATWIGTSPPELVSITSSGDGRVAVAGEVDCSTAPRLTACLDSELASAPAELVIDLTEVSFLDSAGLHALVTAHAHAGRIGVPMRVLVATRAVLRPIQVTGLEDLLGVERVQPGAETGAA
ncbi:STAS domain-containing protein [Blastococcus sp. URHD0036]|uniref:STAS domain-containing protein n=1 Tax=Blastococcus sp. URHD0036 TaxID=1380356 RepID=UPI00068ADE38|nr:STAS domain-containing protein [Blastococcus sp. URHD0036]